MAIGYDAISNSGVQTGSSGYSWNHTCTGNTGFLAVDIGVLSALNTVTALTYNGVALTFIGAQNALSGVGRLEQWGLANPPQGTFSISVTLSGAVTSAGVAVSYTGVNQLTPTEAFNSATGTNGTPANATVNVTTVADQDWVHAACVSNDTTITANQTARNNVTGAAGSVANEDTGPVSPPAATTVSYAVGAARTWAIGGYGMIPAVLTGGAPGRIRELIGSSLGVVPRPGGRQRGGMPNLPLGLPGMIEGHDSRPQLYGIPIDTLGTTPIAAAVVVNPMDFEAHDMMLFERTILLPS
jgi:hypothetical protein